ncbi:LPXTG cell wall anchor domain-containing protein [Paenibacillus anaericanus]|uniref:LPXTG cell wall anchor domain-containing protein n=1 Tax=Paenibacillus anaericanus TaxID=170367 RepID=UPI003521204A
MIVKDEDPQPKGPVVVISDETPDVSTLPKTGESSTLPFYLIGLITIAIGFILKKTRKHN